MLDFKPITLSDKQWVDELLRYSDFRATEYCFTSLFIWAETYGSTVCRNGDWLMVRSLNKGAAQYVFPAGKGDLREAIALQMEDAEALGRNFMLTSIPTAKVPEVESLFPSIFNFSAVRNTFDYIYSREQLASLSGKKFQPKRNFIARFRELPGWSYESIAAGTPAFDRQIAECIEMTELWCKQNGCIHNMSMHTERCATQKALRNYAPLELRGGLLRLDGRVVAYTVGEAINSDTFIVHVEKAFSDIKGAYPMINQQFILHEAMSYEYINREDDAGDEGLRTAKLSYHPIFMEEKFCALKK